MNTTKTKAEDALKAFIDAYIDTRGCSRLIATGYALEAVLKEYNAISNRTGYRGPDVKLSFNGRK